MPAVQPTIRRELAADAEAIRRVLCDAFPTDAESRLVDALRANGSLTVALVAELGGQVVGHIAFSPITIDGRACQAVGLAPVCVAPSHQNQGFGSALITAGIEACRATDTALVVVLGETNFYPRFGFKPASQFGLDNEYGVDEPFMALELTPGALSAVRGLVRYGVEFGEL